MNYKQVQDAMGAGTPLELICAACPWDRLCIEPPQMTKAEIDKHISEAERKDEERDPAKKGMPVGMLLTAIAFAGRDTSGQLCPVFAARLRSPEGRQVADAIRVTMQRIGEP